MSWPYRFIFTFTPEELSHRRELLDSYGSFAQASVLFALVLAGCFSRLQSSRRVDGIPQELKKVGRILSWKLDDGVAPGWGTWKQLLFGAAVGSWLGLLVVRDTGEGKCIIISSRTSEVEACFRIIHPLLNQLRIW
jgi:hypothetical protein